MLKDSETIWQYEKIQEHDKWVEEIPYLTFPSDWKVQITPPFAGAVVRFQVRRDDKSVSVYLDCYNRLGAYGFYGEDPKPYWEVYPVGDDGKRIAMNDTDELIATIKESLEQPR